MKGFGNPTNRQFETQVPEINSGEIDSSDIEPFNVVPEDNFGTEPADDRAQNLAMIRNAKQAGYNLACSGKKRPTAEELRKRHPEYTEEAVRGYLERYDNKRAEVKHDSVLIYKAKHLGFKAVRQGNMRPTEEQLRERHPDYTEEAVRAYLDSYDKKAARISKDYVLIEKAKHAGFNYKYKDRKRPTKAELKKRHPNYSQEAVEAYFTSFDNGSVKKRRQLKTNQVDRAVLPENRKNLLLKFPMLARTNQPFFSKKDDKEAVQVDEATNQNSAVLISNGKSLIIKVPMKAAMVKQDHQNENSIMKVKPH